MQKIALVTALLTLSTTNAVWAGDYGTEAEARTMLEAAVEAMKTDVDQALSSFNRGDAPFKEKDLYVFCGKGENGTMTAHGANSDLLGLESMGWTDKSGKLFVKEMWDVATEGEMNVVDYMWPRPGAEEPVAKASFVTRIGEQLCGVGYYK